MEPASDSHELGPPACTVLPRLPVPGGYEEWFNRWYPTWSGKPRQRRPTKLFYFYSGPKASAGDPCPTCDGGHLPEGLSRTADYARRHGVCISCYNRGVRREDVKDGRAERYRN